MIYDSIKRTRPCPECRCHSPRWPMADGSEICAQCGYHYRTIPQPQLVAFVESLERLPRFRKRVAAALADEITEVPS